MQISYDTSSIGDLNALLERARTRSYRDRTKALKRIADDVAAKAITNAQAFQTDSTGELASVVE
jgi:hypothetical protein